MVRQRIRAVSVIVAVIIFSGCVMGVTAEIAGASPDVAGWEVGSHSYPTHLLPGGTGIVSVDVYSVGAAANEGTVTVTDTLPDDITGVSSEGWNCTAAVRDVCTYELESLPVAARDEIPLEVKIDSDAVEGSFANEVVVAGGGALSPAGSSSPLTVSSAQAGFGLVGTDLWFTNADGTVDTQAGSHPYGVTFNWELDAESDNSPAAREEVRNLKVNLPPGLIGNPTAVPRCTRQQFDATECPASSQIGIDEAGLGGQGGKIPLYFSPISVYNMVPPPGIPAQFAFNLLSIEVFVNASVRSGGDYGITTSSHNIPQRDVVTNSFTLWGVPSDRSHDAQRCEFKQREYVCGLSDNSAQAPFLTLPTSCEGPQTVGVAAGSWRDGDPEAASYEFLTHESAGTATGFTGCDHLGFSPSISVAPDTSEADTPAGLTVDVKVPQEGLSQIEGLATSNIRDTTVTLPQGVVINPGQAAGLAACQASEDAVGSEGAPSCPAASKVGTVEISTPLLSNKLEGDVYVLQSNPPDLQLLVAASGSGVNLKLVGDVHLNRETGRLTTTFANTPELPFTDFKLSFSGGAQAALATPVNCGVYATSSDFTPWSAPAVGDAFPSSSFSIVRGPNDDACPSSPLQFTPQLIAGSTTDQAGGFTNFSLLLQRADDQQRVQSLQFKIPQGLLGMISKVPLCGEPQAQDGTCPAASQIGHTVVAAGPGPYPLVVPQPGQSPAPIYLTGPYKGAPYGLSIVVPLQVGPFVLETQRVRAKIEVDPSTAQITVTTDPFPQIIDGIPTDLRTVNAVIDRPGFMFNPTNCSPMSFSGTAWGTPPPGVGGPGSTAAISSPFQMGSCRSLLFKPSFKVSTSGKTSRKNGASLDAKIVYPRGPLGANQASSQSNLKSVKVDLPKQLPSRLTTLQKACTSATFEANPASCPADSRVGTASAITPVLPVTLTGPAYFVSYGGAKFPELVFALQGYGVTIYVHGETFINKAGITSSTFHQVPDVPIYQFELKLPQGPFSALAANGNLCNTALKMPTAFTAQDGAVIHQTTPISVTGCSKHKAKRTKTSIKHKRKK
jgi:hypothetical protein